MTVTRSIKTALIGCRFYISLHFMSYMFFVTFPLQLTIHSSLDCNNSAIRIIFDSPSFLQKLAAARVYCHH